MDCRLRNLLVRVGWKFVWVFRADECVGDGDGFGSRRTGGPEDGDGGRREGFGPKTPKCPLESFDTYELRSLRLSWPPHVTP